MGSVIGKGGMGSIHLLNANPVSSAGVGEKAVVKIMENGDGKCHLYI